MVKHPTELILAACRHRPFLRNLVVTAAGYFPKALGHQRRRATGIGETVCIYCVKGGGCCEVGGRLHPLRPGSLAVLPPGIPHAYASNDSNPWTIHWVHVKGDYLREYLRELGVSPEQPVIWLGEDLQITLLFNEVLRCLRGGLSSLDLLHAASTMAHLLSLMTRRRQERRFVAADGVQRVARAIEFISENFGQPVRVSQLAALANLSPAHFTVLFKAQTGCSPRDYLHLLRIHRACQLLTSSASSIKEIAGQLGYQDPFHFSRKFKAFQGVSPSDYRQGKRPDRPRT